MSTGQGDFTLPDSSGTAAQTELTTLFGVNQAVGQAPVLLQGTSGLRQTLARHGEPVAGVAPTQTVTLTQALQGFYGMDPDVLANLQEQMYAAGPGVYYPEKYYTKTGPKVAFGTPDDDSYAAFKKAVVQAARSGRALPDLLSDAAAAHQAGAGGKTAVQFTHPDDLRAALDTVGPNVIGRRPDPAAYDNFVAGYHEMESAAANQPDDQGNVTAPPSPSAAAEQYLRRVYPADAYRSGYVNAFDAFRQMISGGSGG